MYSQRNCPELVQVREMESTFSKECMRMYGKEGQLHIDFQRRHLSHLIPLSHHLAPLIKLLSATETKGSPKDGAWTNKGSYHYASN